MRVQSGNRVEVGIAGLQKVAPTNHHTITLARTVSKKMNVHIQFLLPGVHNAKAEECTTPYMRQNIEINIGVGGLHGNQGY